MVDALFRQAGVIRVDTLEELLDTGQLLASQPALAGHRLAIVGNAGGAAVLAADACEAAGLSVPEFDAATQAALRALAGPNAGVSNPVDLGAGATPNLFDEALRVVLASPSIDGAVVILAPVATADPEDVARAVVEINSESRPLVFVHLGDSAAPAALSQGPRKIPSYAFPERAVRALGRIAEHSSWKTRPAGKIPQLDGVDVGVAQAIVKGYLAAHNDGGWVAPDQAVAMLRAFGIATPGEISVSSPEAGASAAAELGFPVALKAVGATILHKSDVGGVRLDLTTADEVAEAYGAMAKALGDAMDGALVQQMLHGVELIAGVITDPLFGPVVMFGSGGTAVELFGDRVLRILPVTDQDAHEMVRSIRGAPLLFGHRGAPPCDVVAVEEVLLRVARLAEEIPQVAEMDLNPVIASPRGAVAVDVRIRLIPWRRHAETEVRRLR